jgi:hypothetical protein
MLFRPWHCLSLFYRYRKSLAVVSLTCEVELTSCSAGGEPCLRRGSVLDLLLPRDILFVRTILMVGSLADGRIVDCLRGV